MNTVLNKQIINEENTLLSNLLELMEIKNITEAELAKMTGVAQSTLNKILLGQSNNPRIKTLMLIANALNVSIDSLVNPNDNLLRDSSETIDYFLPALTWQMLDENETIADINLKHCKHWQHIRLDKNEILSKHAFVLQSKPFLEPIYPQGTIFVIDPDSKPLDGDTVLVKINNQITLRKLCIDPPNQYLKSITVASDAIMYDQSSHFIIGINIMTIFYNRKLGSTWIENQNQ